MWLIETNHMPSLSGSSALDSHIKTGVVNGALDRLNVTPKRKHVLGARLKKKRQGDLMQQVRGSKTSTAPTPTPYPTLA